MERMSVFYSADNEFGYVQAVIQRNDLAMFEQLGFVKHIDDLKKAEPKAKNKLKKDKAADNAGNANEG
jgi:hypothetical protein